jgi:hypothetical protein
MLLRLWTGSWQIRPYSDQANPPIRGIIRVVIAVLFLICQAEGQFGVAEPARTVQVRSYVRKDGTVVKGYTRAAPGTG